jgi:DNA-binding transcriptional MerR regulator
MKKNNLLSIGELSKLTGVSVQAIRHYEKIELLKPSFTDPETNYRYYSLQHPELLDYIILALEFGIPLKTLRDYFKSEDIIELESLIAYAKEEAEAKITALQQGYEALCTIEKAIEKAKDFPIGEIYDRNISVQNLNGATIQDISEGKLRCLELYQSMDFAIEETPDFGVMLKNNNSASELYAFVEVPIHSQTSNLTLDSGLWKCYRGFEASLDNIDQIFSDYLKPEDDFIAIQSEVISSRVHIEKPLYELRIFTV